MDHFFGYPPATTAERALRQQPSIPETDDNSMAYRFHAHFPQPLLLTIIPFLTALLSIDSPDPPATRIFLSQRI